MYIPKEDSSKGENGKLLVIGGSKKYSGASILNLKPAVKFCDIVLFYPSQYDEFLINSVKVNVPEVIVVYEYKKAVERVDCLLFGSGLGDGLVNLNAVKKAKKLIIDGDGLRFVDKELGKNVLLTPNKKEFERLANKFGANSVKELANELGCVVLKKGRENIISDGEREERIIGGNAGLTKAGTGDVLAGIIAGLSTKNDLFESAVIGLKIIHRAADVLFEKKGHWYSASELIDFIDMKGI